MVSVREQNQQDKTHLGIGLYIARIIAEFHQGHITIENNADQTGVIANIWLPLITKKNID